MMNAVRILEELTVFTPLGIRFWDPVRDEQIRDGLRVTAWPATGHGPVSTAFRTASDIYAFQGLPGLLTVEYRHAELEPAASPPPSHLFVVQVEDTLGRFLPVALGIELPLPYRGVFLGNGAISPSSDAQGRFLLYSAPIRTAPSWLATIRGELVEQGTGQPAAHAVVQVRTPERQNWFGLADASGRFAVYLPYPTLADGFGASPPGIGQGSLLGQTWAIGVEVRYEPERLEALPGAALFDYLSILSQAPASVWALRAEDGGFPEGEWIGELEFGQERVLRTEGLTQLEVSPAGSPP